MAAIIEDVDVEPGTKKKKRKVVKRRKKKGDDGGDDGDVDVLEETVSALEAVESAPRPPALQQVLVVLKLLDDTCKKMFIDEHTTGQEFLTAAAAKMDLYEVEHFNVFLESSGTWIEQNMNLLDQGVEEGSVILLRVRFFASSVMDFCDPVAAHLYYLEVKNCVMRGLWPVDEQQAVKLASLKLQVDVGDNDPNTHKPGYFQGMVSLATYFPPDHRPPDKKNKDLQLRLFELHAQYAGQLSVVAEINYACYCEDLPTYGAVYFDCTYNGSDVKFAVTPRGYFLQNAAGQMDTLVPWSRMQSWSARGNDLVVRTEKGNEEVFSGRWDASDVAVYLDGYKRFHGDGQVVSNAFMNKKQTIRINLHTCDGSAKVLEISEATTAQELLETFSEKLGLKDLRFFQICDSTTDGDRWLDPRKPVLSQFVSDETSRLYMKLRYFFVDEEHMQEITDPIAKHLYYLQFKKMILDGYYVVSEKQAIDFCAHHLYIEYGIFDPHLYRANFLINFGLTRFVPTWMIDAKEPHEWEHVIYARLRHLDDLGTEDSAMMEYIDKARAIPTYGLTYFTVKDSGGNDKLLGVHVRGIVVLDPVHYKKQAYWPYKHVRLQRTAQRIRIVARVIQHTNDPLTDGSIAWEESDFWPSTPLEGASIYQLASLYHRFAYENAKKKAF